MRIRLFSIYVFLLATTAIAADPESWLQWGGPKRNFMLETKSLPDTFPEGGPKRLWNRELGEGHSSILVENGRLYTMYRPSSSDQEAVIALDAATGKTVWEHRYDAPSGDLDFSRGAGPHGTPLIVGDRLFASGTRKMLLVLDKRSGKPLWSHDLMKEYGAPKPGRGHAPSPLAYKNTVIVPAGGAGQALMAFNQHDGSLVWKAGTVQYSPASPVIINIGGQDQLVYFAGDQIAGFNPNDGALLWTHPHQTEYGLNISTPVWGSDNILLVSSAYNSGSRALKLTQSGGKTTVEELWFNNRMRVHFGTIIRLGDYAYGSSGDFGPAFLTAINVKTGEVAWQDRSFARASFVYADGKLLLLDEDGTLGLATVSPSGLKVLARAPVMTRLAWTLPTLAGRTVYVRDRKSIAAYGL